MVISKTRETKSKANKKYSWVSLSPNIWLSERDGERFFQNQRVKNDKKKIKISSIRKAIIL